MALDTPFHCDSHPVRGARLSYLDSGGDRPPLHFYHANGFPVSVYLPFMTRLAEDFRVMGMGVRGQDAQSEGNTSWHDVAEDLISFLDARNAGPVIGVGHSVGGAATMMAAALRPDLFSKIILIDPAILPYRYVLAMAVIRVLGRKESFFLAKRARGRKNGWADHQAAYDYLKDKSLFKNFDDAFLRSYVTYGLTPSPRGGVELLCPPEAEARIFENYPLDVWLWPKRVTVPALIIRGEHSDVLFPRSVRRFCGKCKGSQSHLVRGAGHLVPMEKPDEVLSAVRRFAQA
ncbi:alpha/beta hydrolase [Desulfatiferula olefinivorans]